MPGQIFSIKQADGPIEGPVTKFGGRPNWLEQPAWPISRTLGKPMVFLGQVALGEDLIGEGGRGKVAYIFMTDDQDDWVDETWEPEGGENAVVIQPGGDAPLVSVGENATGPTLPSQGDAGQSVRGSSDDFAVTVATEADDAEEPSYNRLGGEPIWLQGDETPKGGSWKFVLSLDSTDVPFYVNFGDAGVAYVFVTEDGRKGRFLWQCL